MDEGGPGGMREVVLETAPRGGVKMTVAYDDDHEAVARRRCEVGDGFTKDRSLRLIGEVSVDDLFRICGGNGRLVQELMADGEAMRRLIKTNPAFRVCSGAV